MIRPLGIRAAVVFLSTLTVAACGDSPGSESAARRPGNAGGVAVFCALNTPDALNPFVSRDQVAGELRTLLYTPLVLYDSVGGVRPHLASSWTWSDDQRSVLFTLRNDLHWHDGQPVGAADVAWTLRAAADSAYPYWGRGEVADVDSVTAVDGGVRVTFKKPFPAGLEPFTRIPILPRHLLDTIPPADFDKSPYHREPVGSGPFRYAGRLPDGSIKLDRVADYPEDLGRPLLDRIVLREVPDPSALLVELKTGGVDLCTVGSSIAGEAAAAGNTIVPIAPMGALIIPLDNRKAPFTDARVRRAISAALNRTEIAATVSRAAIPARNFLPDVGSHWRDTAIAQPDNDVALAGALLDSAGWRLRPNDPIRRNAAGAPLRFTITAPAPLQTVLTVVQSQLRRAGVDAQLRMMEPTAFYGLLGRPDARPAALAVTFTPDRIAIPDPSVLFHSRGEMNIAGSGSPEVDSVLDQLKGVLPDDERARLYHEIERYIANAVPIIYTVNSPRMLAVRPRLRDVRVDANGPFVSAAEWWIPAEERRQ